MKSNSNKLGVDKICQICGGDYIYSIEWREPGKNTYNIGGECQGKCNLRSNIQCYLFERLPPKKGDWPQTRVKPEHIIEFNGVNYASYDGEEYYWIGDMIMDIKEHRATGPVSCGPMLIKDLVKAYKKLSLLK